MRRPGVVIDGVTHARVKGGLSGETTCGERYLIGDITAEATQRRKGVTTRAHVDCMACITGGLPRWLFQRGTTTGRLSMSTLPTLPRAGKSTSLFAMLAKLHQGKIP